ncbi:MAG: hypothetical protein K5649_02855 [Lachnospiraceae bacterium]|nr:hypothetical protein [Lachnospiraceae bacterium]
MSNQDKRAVESMCRCGLDFDGVCACFSSFPKEDIREIYNRIQKYLPGKLDKNIKVNCS